jgi:hypothetical protein
MHPATTTPPRHGDSNRFPFRGSSGNGLIPARCSAATLFSPGSVGLAAGTRLARYLHSHNMLTPAAAAAGFLPHRIHFQRPAQPLHLPPIPDPHAPVFALG